MTSRIGSEPRRDRPQAGFTLLELLVVTLILSVLVALSVPQFRGTFRHLQLQVFASDVATLLTYASRRAVARGEVLRIQFDVKGRRYWLARAEEASATHEASPAEKFEQVSGKFGRVASAPGSISFTSSAPEVTFYPDGRADRFEMLIFDDSHAGYRLVTDVRTGRVKLSESHGSGRR
jgi:prepilin-type N-terminal cleavage/methylation domain-containing protein